MSDWMYDPVSGGALQMFLVGFPICIIYKIIGALLEPQKSKANVHQDSPSTRRLKREQTERLEMLRIKKGMLLLKKPTSL